MKKDELLPFIDESICPKCKTKNGCPCDNCRSTKEGRKRPIKWNWHPNGVDALCGKCDFNLF